MAAFYLIATLIALQGLLFSYSMAVDDMDGSGSGSEITPTPSQMMSTPSSSVATRTQGAKVTLTLNVSIDCGSYNLTNFTNNLEDAIEQVYKNEAFPIHTVNVMGSCDEDLERFDAIITLSFYTGISSEKTIEGVFEGALTEGDIPGLTPSNTNFSIKFDGVTLTYVPKDGECEAICCDGAGGALTVKRMCTPADKCEGIKLDEKEAEGYCPGEVPGTCPDTCDDDKEASGSRNNLPTFCVVILLVLTKTLLC